MARMDEMFCTRCNRMLPETEFYKSHNKRIHTAGYTHLCKACCKEIFQEYLKEYGDLQRAIYFTCASVGIPFIQECYHIMEERVAKRKNKDAKVINYFGNYFQVLTNNRTKLKKWSEFADTDTALNEIVSVNEMKRQIEEDTEVFKLDWGDFPDPRDYQFLEYRYDIYTDGLPKLKPAQETLYRKLCIAELNSRKIEARGESTKDIQKQILDLMNKLKIDNFAEVKDKNLVEQMLESQIRLHETKMPMEFYDEQELYSDVCGLKNGFEDIKRCMLNFAFSQKEYPKIKKDGVVDGES